MAERKKRRLSESCSSSSTEPMEASSESFYRSDATGSRSPAPSNVSMMSDQSKEWVPDYSGETAPSSEATGSRSSAPSNVSLRSHRSKEWVPDFSGETAPSSQITRSRSSARSNVSLRSDHSKFPSPDFAGETAPSQSKQCSVCKEALKARESYQSSSTSDEFCPKCQKPTPETHGEEPDFKLKKKLKKEMQKKFSVTAEGNGDPNISLKSIYTTLYVTKGESLSDEHEFRHLKVTLKKQSSEDSSVNLTEMFKSLEDQGKPHRRVLTKGVAGIGKSFAVQKFIVDWAEEEANQHIDFVFCLAFRELNLVRKEKSLNELLSDFHPALQSVKDPPAYNKAKIVIILDGLDESRLKFNFENNKTVLSLSDVTSVDNLLVNLIQGNLLPEANIWITSRPAAASQIPEKYIDLVTEIRGFTDDQKVEYFKRRCSDDLDFAARIISHIQSSQCLDIMCQIPIFCWLCSVLFSEVFGGDEKAEIPQTLTEMMAHFVFAQTKRRSRKYENKSKTHMQKLLQTHKEFLLKLGRLAFFQLLDKNLIFYEEDLRDNGIDTEEASIYSGFCNTVLREEKVFYQRKIFFFVHLTLQEFFAALYVYECFTTKKTKELVEFLKLEDKDYALADLIKMTVDKVLEKKNDHLDFFMRFLLGLMIEPNRRPLQGMLTSVDPNEDADKKVLTYLKSLRRKNLSPDSCINIFQALVEIRDHKLKDKIREYLQLDSRSKKELTPLHCSALAYMLQVSKNELEELDLKSYNTTDEGRRRLIPAVRSSKKAVLKDCKVTAEWIEHLVFGLKFPFSPLRDLDLSNNDLKDSGVKLLCGGLSSPCCKLQVLRLSGCCITRTGCEYLVSALKSNTPHLVELDLSYNHLGETGIKLISEQFKQQKLNFKHDGSIRTKPGFLKYACKLTLDSKTAHKNLLLSDGNRKVTWVEKEQPYPDHKERFEHYAQVLCEQGLQERCYFEIEVVEPCTVGLTYKSINRKGDIVDRRFGMNEKSWSQSLSGHGCYIWHKNSGIFVSSLRYSRVGVYLDYEAGCISFYKVSSDSRSRLYTYKDLRFSEALYPAVELHPHSSACFL